MLGIHNKPSLLVLVFTAVFCTQSLAAIETRLINFWNDSEPLSQINVDHSPLQEILQTYVLSDHPSGIARFDYARVSVSDKFKLGRYLDYLQLLEPRQLNEPEAKAYWVNLYNAALLNMVLEAYEDRASIIIRGRGLPARRWRRDIVTIAQQDLSLDDILHGVIRPLYKDPRVHFALFSCALGGPDMPTEVMQGDNNDALLDKLESQFLSHSRALRLDSGDLVLSELFRDFDTDFASNQAELIRYLQERVPEPVGAAITGVRDIRFDYDWALNAP